MKIHYLLFLLLAAAVCFPLYSQDRTSDLESKLDEALIQKNIDQEELKNPPVVFDLGGYYTIKSRLLIGDNSSYAVPNSASGFLFAPYHRWVALTGGNFWTSITVEEDSYMKLNIRGLLKMQQNSLIPMFNIDELYWNWKYPMGRVIAGRTYYTLNSSLIFNGPLDAVQLTIEAPFLTFKSFIGFSGFLGVFNPWFNPYNITTYEKSHEEETNLLTPVMVAKLNAPQSRRIFFSLDFDLHFFGQHINPYFLMAYDISTIPIFGNSDYLINTFHTGLNFNGRIYTNLYYKVNISGVFGTKNDQEESKYYPIVGGALETNLRYTIPKAKYSTLILQYAFGSGTHADSGSFWSDNTVHDQNNKFYYYGKFNGGFVLAPVLTNIHSLSVKYLITPVTKKNLKLSFYTAFYQTFKFYINAPISDVKAENNDFVIGSEVDAGLLFMIKNTVSLGIDSGVFIPQTAYTDRTVRIRMGANLTIGF